MEYILILFSLLIQTSTFAQLEKMGPPPNEPFTDFLQEPISEVSVSFYFGGCYLQNTIQVTYKKTTDNHLKAKYWTEKHQDGDPNFFKDSSTRLFYQSIVHDIDTLSSSTILQTLQYCPNLVYISAYADLEITIKNQQQDSIKIIKKGLLNPTPWNLPLTICHHQKCFESYHPELVKVLREYLPNTAIFLNRGFPHCQNKYLIKQIADYLYQQQKE
jgi:hypothetical protein